MKVALASVPAGDASAADLGRRSLSALAWNIAGGGGRVIAQLLIQIVLARMLGPEAFGQYSAVLVVLGIGWLLAEGGFGAALVQKPDLEAGDVQQALGWVLLLASLISAAIAGAAPWLAGQFGDPSLTPMFRWVGALVFLIGLSNISSSLLRRDLDMKRLQIIQLLSYLIGFGLVAMTLASAGFGAWSLVIGFGTQTAITFFASYAIARHSLRPRLGGDQALRRYGLKVVATNIANWAIENLDRFLVGRIWGVQALGLYAVAFNLSRAPVGMLVGAVQSVAFSSASRIQADDQRMRRSYLAVTSALALTMFPPFFLICLEAETVMQIIYGSRWSGASPMLAAFSVTTPIYALVAITGPMLWARGQVEKELYSQIAIAFVLLGGFVLLRSLPLDLAVWVVPLAYLFRFLFMYSSLGNLLVLTYTDLIRVLMGGAALTLVACGTDLLLHEVLNGRSFPGATLLPILGALLALAWTFWFRGARLVSEELKSILQARQTESRLVRVFCKLIRLPLEAA